MQKIDVKDHDWLTAEPLSEIMKCIAAYGGEVRVVGGAVRDILLGRQVRDVDLAVNLPPDETQDILEKSGYRIVPTGVKYGTIMVLADGQSFEMTSLRRDIKTDGRHAHVTYTQDWQEDAQRRDFTINALYLDAAGQIYDYVDGLADIDKKLLRFIGKPQDRIQEDILRILRYFRFLSELGDAVALDQEALTVCGDLAHLLPDLSAERIWQELSRMLVGKAAMRAVRLMRDGGLWQHFLPSATNFKRYESLMWHGVCSPVLCMAALIASVEDDLLSRLRLSKKEAKLLTQYVDLVPVIKDTSTPYAIRQMIYDEGTQAVRGALLLAMADGDKIKENLLPVIDVWECPVFPLRGKDIQAMGIQEGPEIGGVLSMIETWWREDDFQSSRDDCLERLKELNGG